jgi:hypothetical protein
MEMGLDMYLKAKRYLSPHRAEDKDVIAEIESIAPRGTMKPLELTYEAAYWRKANAIHAWFVENVQDGEDDCKTYYVSTEDLENLLEKCKQVEQSRNEILASKLLPTQGGFFFGSTEYDDGYWHDIRITIEQLEAAIAEASKDDHIYFEYYASW